MGLKTIAIAVLCFLHLRSSSAQVKRRSCHQTTSAPRACRRTQRIQEVLYTGSWNATFRNTATSLLKVVTMLRFYLRDSHGEYNWHHSTPDITHSVIHLLTTARCQYMTYSMKEHCDGDPDSMKTTGFASHRNVISGRPRKSRDVRATWA